ncbi:Serine/threonine-protein kinase SAPK2 [Coccomyxa sp. Obi]|nr:Serine/threonine-protein kinase SAPK2 [Coccomyxa sp. Obi]
MRHKRSKELVAVKLIKQSTEMLLDKNVEREILNHRQLVHPNIIAFKEVYTTDTDLAIVVEYASAGQLADKCRSPMPEDQARGLFSQLLEGLAYCHSKGVYHRDLRSELIFLSGSVFKPRLKIGGFGFSKSAAMDSMAKTAVGTRGYMAPEVLLATGAYDAAATDVWAAGVVLFQMLTARMPFCHDANASGILDRAMMQRIVRGQYYLPGDVELSLEVQDLLARIFRPDPKQRISLAAMRRHPWLHHNTPSVLSAAPDQVSTRQSSKSAAADDAEAPAQSEDGIRDVIHRARQRRLLRQRNADGGAGGNQELALDRVSHSIAASARS